MFSIASLTTAAVLAADSAAAAPIEARIPYGDLDLSSRAGATAFDSRVQRVARTLCTGRQPVERLHLQLRPHPGAAGTADRAGHPAADRPEPSDHRTEHALKSIIPPERVALMIGPEGGLSPEEIAHAEKEGFLPVALGPRVLRTETAPVAAMALCQWLWGDIGG